MNFFLKNEDSYKKIYGDNAQAQFVRYNKLKDKFIKQFGLENGIQFFSTPGRSEIIGNHTDHNCGRVLAASINLDAVAAVVKTNDMKVMLVSEGYFDDNTVDLNNLNVTERGNTRSLIRGIAKRLKDKGYNIGGFRAYVTSDVLRGSGLSSSASIEILIFTIFNHLYNNGKIDSVEGAIISQWAENNYFGKPCGLMDPAACAMGRLVSIDFADPAQPVIECIDCDFSKYGYDIIITDVHADHADLTNEYTAITVEMRMVARFFEKTYLRDVSEDEFYKRLSELREAIKNDRAVLRAIHFFEENKRVINAINAVKNNDIQAFLNAINASGDSSCKLLQNTHATGSTSQAMTLALILAKHFLNGKGACRVHGGGFGGTILAFVPKEDKNGFISQMEAVFGTGSCILLSIRPVGTVRV